MGFYLLTCIYFEQVNAPAIEWKRAQNEVAKNLTPTWPRHVVGCLKDAGKRCPHTVQSLLRLSAQTEFATMYGTSSTDSRRDWMWMQIGRPCLPFLSWVLVRTTRFFIGIALQLRIVHKGWITDP